MNSYFLWNFLSFLTIFISKSRVVSFSYPLVNLHHLETNRWFSTQLTKLQMAERFEDNLGKTQTASKSNSLMQLSASTMSNDFNTKENQIKSSLDINAVFAVLAAAFLITGDTVGAGTLVLPELASQIGMIPTICLFTAIYVIGLVAGLVISEVAIEENKKDWKAEPSSFKDLAKDLSFLNLSGGTIVSSLSIFMNWCILSFALIRAASVLSGVVLQVDPALAQTIPASSISTFVALSLIAVVSSQSTQTLSKVASLCVFFLFLSLGAVLVPGLAHMNQDVAHTLLSSSGEMANMLEDGRSPWEVISVATPIFLTLMVYQNIVPTVCRLLNYDREKIFSALAIGSGIPTIIYILLCLAVVGGGVDITMGSQTIGDADGLTTLLPQSICLQAFSVATVTGSSLTCVISLTQEFKSHLSSIASTFSIDGEETLVANSDASLGEDSFPLAAVILAVIPPLFVGILLAGDSEVFTAPLEYFGSYGTPLLYGLLPLVLTWKQRKSNSTSSVIPGGVMSETLLLLCTIGFVGGQFFSDLSQLWT